MNFHPRPKDSVLKKYGLNYWMVGCQTLQSEGQVVGHIFTVLLDLYMRCLEEPPVQSFPTTYLGTSVTPLRKAEKYRADRCTCRRQSIVKPQKPFISKRINKT